MKLRKPVRGSSWAVTDKSVITNDKAKCNCSEEDVLGGLGFT